MFQLVKIIDSSAPHQGDIRCFKKMGGGEEKIVNLKNITVSDILKLSIIY